MSDDTDPGDFEDISAPSADSLHHSGMGDDQSLGATIVPDGTCPGTGWKYYEDGKLLFDIQKSYMAPGGFDIHRLGSGGPTVTDMGSVLDSFGFHQDDVRLPWSPKLDHEMHEDVVGTPDIDQGHWEHQTTAFTCAVEAQRGIIEEFTGQHVSEAQLTYEATANGWLSDHGMSPADAGNLLELHGIDCHSSTGATVEDLMTELAQGHKVIVGVDSGELWHKNFPLKDFFHQSADHAIWVTGVDMTDSAHPKVIVNDSGDPTGAGKAYDLQTFAKAWQDSGFFYVATNDTPPDMSFAAEHGFDARAGVFPELVSYFGNLYNDFRDHLTERLEDQAKVTPAETPTLFTDAAVRAFIENLPKSPMASFNESTTDTLFRII